MVKNNKVTFEQFYDKFLPFAEKISKIETNTKNLHDRMGIHCVECKKAWERDYGEHKTFLSKNLFKIITIILSTILVAREVLERTGI